MGPPGSFRMEYANYLKEQFTWKAIHTGELLKQQAEKKTDLGKKISDSLKSYQYGKSLLITVINLSVIFS